jgi:hypothetical protein
VPSEMLSGPDLGGGYLHQLTLDRNGEATTYTYHAQEGGQDAGGPPTGGLDRLGFAHPADACQFGGPRCWHRRFLLPFTDLPKVRLAYNRFRFVLETMLNQVHGGAPVGIDAALAELVRRIGPTLRTEGIEWFIGGSTASRLLGATLSPNDIDLGTTRAGVDRIAQLIPEYLIEPLAPTDWPPHGIVRGARAFVGTFRDGARVEWSVPIEPNSAVRSDEWGEGPTGVRTLEVLLEGITLRVSRPEYGLVRSAEHRATARVTAVTELIRKVGPDLELLRRVLATSSLGSAERDALVRSVEV